MNTSVNKNIAFSFVFSTLLLSSMPSFATVEVKALPNEDDVVDLGSLAYGTFSKKLEYMLRVATGDIRDSGRSSRFPYATKEEARQFFSEYVSEWLLKTGKSLDLENDFFTEQYFGRNPSKDFNGNLNSQRFVIPQDESERANFYLNEKSLGILNKDLIRNIFSISKKIMQMSKQGDYLIIFGNTPYFVGRALSLLASSDPEDRRYRVIIEFPFSGSPNRPRGKFLENFDDYVTPARLEHLRERMRRAGLSSQNEKLLSQATYFIDVVGTCAGIAYISELILRDFSAHGMSLPDLNVICLNEIIVYNRFDRLISKIAKVEADRNGQIVFYLPSIDDTHFSINAREMPLEGVKDLDLLPSPDERAFPQYNPCYWQEEYDVVLTQQKNCESINVLIQYFDANIKRLIEADEDDIFSSITLSDHF